MILRRAGTYFRVNLAFGVSSSFVLLPFSPSFTDLWKVIMSFLIYLMHEFVIAIQAYDKLMGHIDPEPVCPPLPVPVGGVAEVIGIHY